MRATLLFVGGWIFYALAEIVPLMGVVGVWAVLDRAPIPLREMILFIDWAKPFFMIMAIPSLSFLFYSFSYLRLTHFQSAILYSLATWTMILAIPDMIWPVGDVYYETLKYYFGLCSMILAYVTIGFYVSLRRIQRTTN